MPEAYDQDGGVNQEKRFSVAMQRYRLFTFTEDESNMQSLIVAMVTQVYCTTDTIFFGTYIKLVWSFAGTRVLETK